MTEAPLPLLPSTVLFKARTDWCGSKGHRWLRVSGDAFGIVSVRIPDQARVSLHRSHRVASKPESARSAIRGLRFRDSYYYVK